MPRRYRIGINPAYDRRYDWLKGGSLLLNPNGKRFDFKVMEATALRVLSEWNTKEGVECLVHDWKGFLAQAQELLDRAILEVELDKGDAFRAGRAEPVETPQQAKHRLELEAYLDIVTDELARLEKRLKEFKSVEAAKPENRILGFGPRGISKGGFDDKGFALDIVKIDGQRVQQTDKGPVINEPASPYHGMMVRDYRAQIVLPWLKSKRRMKAVRLEELPPRPPTEVTGEENSQPVCKRHPQPQAV